MYEAAQPPLTFDYLAPLGPARVTPQAAQNLLRPTNKGLGRLGQCACVGQPSSGGSMITKMSSLDGLGALAQVSGLGQQRYYAEPTWLTTLRIVLGITGGALGTYHGYKRNRGSIGWAIGWGVLGYIFPIITTVVALAQGYGKPKRK